MLGTNALPKSITSRPRKGTKSVLTFVTGAALFAIAGTAQAQEDCVGGYRMIKGEIPVQCDVGSVAPSFGVTQPAFQHAPLEEPLTTGSIGSVNEPLATVQEPRTMTYGGIDKCVDGYWYRPGVENSFTTLPMRCQ